MPSATYKDFTYNLATSGLSDKWGVIENQLDKDEIDNIVNDTYSQVSDPVNGHTHYRIWSPVTRIPVIYCSSASQVSIANISGVTPSNQLHVVVEDAVNSATTYVARFDHNTTGTPATGIATGILLGTEAGVYGDIGFAGIVGKPKVGSSNQNNQLELQVMGLEIGRAHV